MHAPFDTWLAELADAPIERLPAAMAVGNQLSFSVTFDEASALNVEDVIAFVDELFANKRRVAARAGLTGLRMYAWHDEQAGQLRCSIANDDGHPLPFGCAVRRCPDLRIIVRAWLHSPYLEGIPIAELTPTPSKTPPEIDPAFQLDVWEIPLC